MINGQLGPVSAMKLDLMFDGIRYSDALGDAAADSYPNYYPYRFAKDEFDPTGNGKAAIPYLITLPDETLIRIKGSGDSPWAVSGSRDQGYFLNHDDGRRFEIDFAPLPAWLKKTTSDDFPMAQTGLSLHADMAVVNVAPGCEYFLEKHDGVSMRCTFCAYGAPDKRTQDLGQEAGQTLIPARTLTRLQETLAMALEESDINQIYLVGGSMTDWLEEGNRFIQLAREVQAINANQVPVACGSGAIPIETLETLHSEKLTDCISFNLEIWSPELFAKICPGKNRFVGYDRWIQALENGVKLWGAGRVYSAMVAGIELEPEHDMTWEQAADIAIAGAEDLCSRGIIPIYSLYWPVGGREHPEYLNRLRAYFERLSLGYQEIRQRHGLKVWDGFMSHRSAYMQLECDIDREAASSRSESP